MRLVHHFLAACLALGLISQAYANNALEPTSSQASTAKKALQAARSKNFTQLERYQRQLGSHPLQAYFDFHKISHGLPNLNANEVKQYKQKYADTPLADSIHNMAVRSYGKSNKWSSLLAIQPNEPSSTEAKCYYWRAKYDSAPEQALNAVPDIWLNGNSLPNACDPLFKKAGDQNVLTQERIWQRLLLAFENRNLGMVRHLTVALKGERKKQGEFAQEILKDPEHVLVLPNHWPENVKDTFKKVALLAQVDKDTTKGVQLLQKLTIAPASMGTEALLEAEHKMVWYIIIRNNKLHGTWADQWLEQHGDDELLQQRVRQAIREQNWPQVTYWLNQTSQELRQDPRWQYWAGRALQEQGKKRAANKEFKKAAANRTFWGFLAADQINAPYALNDEAAPKQSNPPKRDALKRIHWLMAMDETGLARSEWLHWVRQHQGDGPALANYALAQQWPAFAVDTAILLQKHNTLAWRFPLAYASEFQRVGKELKEDPYLFMAISRRESAYQQHVSSHAGAVGLMQIMPGTAKQIANWRQEPAPTAKDMKNPLKSIQMGSTYMKRQLEKFNDSRIIALAAYNAGPGNAAAWLGEHSMPYDVWVESIPYYETREYVQAVLSYRVLLEANAKKQTAPKNTLLTKAEKKMKYDQRLLKK